MTGMKVFSLNMWKFHLFLINFNNGKHRMTKNEVL